MLTFGSFRLSAVALVVAGLSAGLSLLALAVFNYPFGITAIIGCDRRDRGVDQRGDHHSDGTSGGPGRPGRRPGGDDRGCDGVEPTHHLDHAHHVGGFLPLILAGGGFWPPFAMSIAGGVLLSSVVSFFFTPQMFALVYARKRPAAEAAGQDCTLVVLSEAA